MILKSKRSVKKSSSKQKIRLLYIITLSEVGGAQKHVYNQLKYLDRSVFEPILIAGQDDWLFRQAESLKTETYHSKHLVRQINPLSDIRALFELLRFIKSIKPDIVHCHSSKAGILGRIAAWISKIPVIIFTAHGWAFTEGVGSKSILYKFLEKWISKITTRIITVSEYDYLLADRYAITEKRKMLVIKNGIDFFGLTDEEEKKKYRACLGIKSDAVVIIMVSRLFPPKDPKTFVQLARLNKGNNTCFLLVGGGTLKTEAEDMIKNNNIWNIKLIGDRDDVDRILSVCDVFCLFSNWEGLPLVVIEAMAAGLPIIANPVGGVPELAKDGINGFLVDKNDIGLVNDKLQTLLKDQSLREKMGNESRRMYSESFTALRMVKETENVYRELYRT